MFSSFHNELLQLENQYDDFFAQGQHANALQIAQKLKEIAEQNDCLEHIAKAYMKIIHCYYTLSENENAYETIVHFRQFSDLHSCPKLDYFLHMINGYIFDYEENFELAANQFYQAMQISIEHDFPLSLAFSRNMFAHTLVKSERLEEAYQFANINYEFIKKEFSSNSILLCHCLHIYATTLVESMRLNEANSILKELANNPLIAINLKEKCRYFFALATFYYKKNLLKKSLSSFNEAEQLAFQLNDTAVLKRIYKYYAKIYAKQNKYKQAFLQMQNYSHLLERVIKSNYSSKIKELAYKHDAHKNERLASIDCLSTLYNRSYLENKTNEWLSECSAAKSVHMIVFDVDYFKIINDNYGHLYGDEVIRHIGQCCKSVESISESFCARYGGDEFIIVIKNSNDEKVCSYAKKTIRYNY